jgi:CHAT domain-containing protein
VGEPVKRNVMLFSNAVDSAATALLMINFHKRLKGQTSTPDSTKADAPRQAALDLMKDLRYRHPFFWAGFVMIGNGH